MTDEKSEIVIAREVVDFNQLKKDDKISIETVNGVNVDGFVTAKVRDIIAVQFPTLKNSTKSLTYDDQGCYIGIPRWIDGHSFTLEWIKVRVFLPSS